MTDEIFFEGTKYISAGKAASSSGFTRDYIGRLCREEKIRGRRVGKGWFVAEDSLNAFLVGQNYSRTLRNQNLAQERTSDYVQAQSIPATSKKAFSSPNKAADDLSIQDKMAYLVASQGNESSFAGVSKLLNVPAGISSAALQAAHIPIYTITPVVDILHKLSALLVVFVVIFGAYDLIEPGALDAQVAMVRSGATSSTHAILALGNEMHRASAIALSAQSNPSAEAASIGSVFSIIAHAVNANVDSTSETTLASVEGFFSSLLGSNGHGQVALRITPYNPPTNTAVAVSKNSSFAYVGPTSETIINQTQPVIERTVETQSVVGGISQAQLTQALQELNNTLTSQMFSLTNANSTSIAQNYSVTAQTNAIDNLTNVAINGASIASSVFSGGSISGASVDATTLTTSGDATIGGTETVSGDLTVSGTLNAGGVTFSSANFPGITATDATITAATTTSLATGELGIGTLTGILQANNGFVSASSTLSIGYGGTGTTSAPSYGELLLGNGAGGYNLVSTSSLGIVGGGGGSGNSNVSTSSQNIWSALQVFSAGASTTNLSVFNEAYFGGTATSTFNSAGQLTLANISNSLLSTNASGQVVATTSIGTSLLTGTLGIGNGGTGIASAPSYGQLLVGNSSGGYNLVSTSSLGITGSGGSSASSTLLIDNNTFSGANTFSGNDSFTQNLSVGSGSSSTLPLFVKSSAGVGSVFGTVFYGQNSTGDQDAFNVRVKDNITDLAADYNGSSVNTNLTFSTRSAGGQLTEQARIDSNGNLGIGTTSPGSLLSLNGIANFTSATSTFYSTGGINIQAGCFSINGTCVSGGSSASSTLLSNNNTFSGTDIFSNLLTLTNGFISNASSTNVGNFTITGNTSLQQATTTNFAITDLASALLSTNANGSVISTTVNTPLSFTGNVLSIQQADGSQSGYLATSDWTNFNNKVSSSSLFSSIAAAYEFPQTGNGTSTLVQFNGGLTAYASSTIGNGSAGLTINGSATTTGTAYFAGNIGIGTTTPTTLLSIAGSTGIYASTTATSTFQGGGINLVTAAGNTGCFAINGTCLSNIGLGANTWTGLQTFSNGYIDNASSTHTALTNFSNASSTLTTLGTTWFTNLPSAILSTNANGQVVATTSIGTNYLTGSLGTINGTSFTVGSSLTVSSTTLLGDNNTFSGNTTLKNATTTNFAITSLANTLLAVNANGTVVATSTIGNNQLQNSSLTVTAGSGLSGGGAVSLGGSTSLSLNLNNANSWTGLQTFGNGFISQASSTLTGAFTVTGNASLQQATTTNLAITNIPNALLSTNANGSVVATTSIGVNYLTGTLSVAQGGTGSTTLTGILLGAGTSQVQTLIVGSGLTLTGSTLATNGAGITAIGPVNETQSGGTQILATTTSSFNGLTAGITIAGSSNTQTFTPTITGTLNVVGGGTGAASFTGGSLLYGNGTGTLGAVATSTLSFSGPFTSSGTLGTLVGGTNFTLTLAQANATTNGYLASGDWTNFNNKISSTSLSGASVISYTSGTGMITTTPGTFGGSGTYTFPNGIITNASSTVGGNFTANGTGRFNGTLTISTIGPCSGSEALQTDASGDISCGSISVGGASSGGGWTTNSTGFVSLSTTTDVVAIGATTTPYAKLTVLSGSNSSTTLALVPAAAQTADVLDIYAPGGGLSSVFTAGGSLGIGTTSPSAALSVAGGGYFTGALQVAGNTTLKNATSSTFAITNLANTLLAVNANGSVVATSTIGNNQLQNSSITVNNTSISLGSSGTITAASSTLLSDNNTFSGIDSFTNASSNFSGTWQTFSPSHFQTAGTYLTGLGNYATTTGTAISISTSTTPFNGLTLGNTFAVSSNGILVTPTITGTLSNAGLAHSTITLNNTTLTLGDTNDTITAASSSLLGDNNTFSGNTTLKNATTTNFAITSLANTLLAVNANGTVVATSTIGNNQLQNSSLTVTAGSGLSGGGAVSLGGSTSLSLNLNNANSWTGLQTFGNGFISQASSTLTGAFTVTGNASLQQATTTNLAITNIPNALLSTNANGSVVATTSIGTNYLTGSLGTINGTSFTVGSSLTVSSTTLLANNNTFSGTDIFSNLLTLSSGFIDNASSTHTAQTNFTNASTTNLTASNELFSATASTTNLILGTPNAVLSTNASGQVVATSSAITLNGTAIGLGGTYTITAASSTLLSNNNTFSGTDIFSNLLTLNTGFISNASSTNVGNFTVTGNTSLQQATTTNFAITSLANTLLAVNVNGTVVATSTIGNNQLQNSSITVSGTSGLSGGGTVSLGGSTSLSLNLSNANNWAALQTFGSGYIDNASSTHTALTSFSNASSTLTTLGTTWFTNLPSAILSTNANGQVVATTSIGTNYLTGSLGTVNGTSFTVGSSLTVASTTLLSNNNTFSGANNFTGNTTLTNATTSNFAISNLASALLAVNANGTVVATSTIGNNQLQSSSLTINTSGPLSGGGAVSLGGSLSLSCPTCTVGGITSLGNYATTTATGISISTSTLAWNGLTLGNTFAVSSNGITVTPTVSGTINNSGLAHSTITVNNTTLTLGDTNDTITAASSTLLSNNNTFSGTDIFSNLLTLNTGFISNASSTNVGNFTVTGTATVGNVIDNGLTANTLLYANVSKQESSATVASSLSFSSGTLSLNTGNSNWWTALQNFTNATTSGFEATSTNVFFDGFKNAILSTNANGQVVASTSIGTNYLTGSLGTVNGVGFTVGSSLTVSSTTLLANNNTFSGTDIFSNLLTLSSGFIDNASSTHTALTSFSNASSSLTTFSGSTWFTGAGLSNAVLSTNANGQVVATTSIGVNYLSGVLPITNGGTNAASQYTHGVLYDNGSQITSGSSMTFDGTNLAVAGSGTFNTGLTISIPSGSSIDSLEKPQATNDVGGYEQFLGGSGAGTVRGYIGFTHTGTGGATFFGSGEAADSMAIMSEGEFQLGTNNSSAPVLTVDDSGNLGIGTSTPGSLLSINRIANFATGTSTLYTNLTLGAINATSTATSTFAGGINVAAGCFSINGTCLSNIGLGANTWTGLQTFSGGYIDNASSTHTALTSFSNASSSLTTFSGSTWFTGAGLSNAILSTNANGQVVASTSIGTNYLTGSLGTVNGVGFTVGSSITVASTTLLSNNNTFSGNDIFSNLLTLNTGFISNASSTVVGAFTTTGTATVGNVIDNGLTANTLLYANVSKQESSATVASSLSFSAGTLSLNTANSNWWTALQNFTNATTSGFEATSTNVFFDGFKNAILSTNANGQVVASTSIGTNYLTGSLGTVNGVGFTVGSSITVASTTLLSNNNTFSGNNIFSSLLSLNGLTDYASSTIGNGTQTGGLTISGGATTTGNLSVQGTFLANAGSSNNVSIDSSGDLNVNGYGSINDTGGVITGYNLVGTNLITAGGVAGYAQIGSYGYDVGLNKGFNFTGGNGNATPDTGLSRLSSDVVAVGNGTQGDYSGTLIAGSIGIGTTTPGSLLSLNGIANFTTATSTFYSTGGINLTAGCFSVKGTCIGGSSGGSSASSTLLSDNNTFSGTDIFSNLLSVNGLTDYASSTIGNGTQGGGLTINGGATTTGNMTIGTTAQNGTLTFNGPSSGYGLIQGNAQYRTMGLVLGFNFNDSVGLAVSDESGSRAGAGISQNDFILAGGSPSSLDWTSGTLSSSYDTNLSRLSAGVVGVGNGTNGDSSGTLIAGSIGIGTTTPSQPLTVSGNGLFTGHVAFGNVAAVDTVTTNPFYAGANTSSVINTESSTTADLSTRSAWGGISDYSTYTDTGSSSNSDFVYGVGAFPTISAASTGGLGLTGVDSGPTSYGSNVGAIAGGTFLPDNQGGSISNGMVGIYSSPENEGGYVSGGFLSAGLVGVKSFPENDGSGTDNLEGVDTGIGSTDGTVGTAYGVNIEQPDFENSTGPATVGTNYGLYIGDQASAGDVTPTTDYQFYSNANGGSSPFVQLESGNVGIGTTTPGSLLSLNGIANFTTATSTFYSTGGINLTAGCFSVKGTCIGGSSGGSSASSTLLSDNNTFSGTDIFSNLLSVNGLTDYASSTIGNGTQGGGLTINGGATTTGTMAIINSSNQVITLSPTALTTGPFGAGIDTFTIGGVAKLVLGNSGQFVGFAPGGGYLCGNQTTFLFADSNNNCGSGSGTAPDAIGSLNNQGFIVPSGSYIGFNSVAYGSSWSNSPDTTFERLSAGVIAIGSPSATTSGKLILGGIGIGTTSPLGILTISDNTANANTNAFLISSSTPTATTTLFSVSNTGSTTIANGVNITAGCFAINGTCITGGGGGGSSASSTLLSDNNTFSGNDIFSKLLTASNGVNVGSNSLGYQQGGNSILYASTTNNSVVVGPNSGGVLFSSGAGYDYNVVVGSGSLGSGSFSGSDDNVFGSSAAAALTSGSHNEIFGTSALNANSSGWYNVAIGDSAGYNNASGGSNIFIGDSAGLGQSGASQSGDVGIGYRSLYSIGGSASAYNVALGYQSGNGIVNGTGNVLIGPSVDSTSENQVNGGTNNISIGYDVAVPSTSANNQLDIGNLIYGTGLNGTDYTVSTGNIGIGTSTPFANLVLNGTTGQNIFQIATSSNQSVLIVNSNGYLGLGTSTPGSILSINSVANFSAATSTFYSTGGINLETGCFSINGTCLAGPNSGIQLTSVYSTTTAGTTTVSFTGGAGTTASWSNGVLTLPSNTVYYTVEGWGGGGGGGAQATNNGAAGGNTCYSQSGTACASPVLNAGGGGGGTLGNGVGAGGAGGVASVGGVLINGEPGVSGNKIGVPSNGGSAPQSGGDTLDPLTGTAAANASATGAGGTGTGTQNATGPSGAGGGGAYANATVSSGATTGSTFVVGAGGAGGAAGTVAGGNGAAGGLVIYIYTPTNNILSTATVNGGTAGQFAFYNVSGNAVSATSSLFVNTTNSFIGIGTTTPGSIFSVNGILNLTAATSTFYSTGGINLTSGCFSINGTCVSGSGGGGTNYFSNSGASTWLSTGTNLGVGTTTPTALLSLQGSSGQLLDIAGASGSSIFHVSSGGNVGVGTTSPWGNLSVSSTNSSSPELVVGSSTATSLLVSNTGNVGIGTTSPMGPLVVVGTGNANNLWVESNANNAGLTINDTQSGGREWQLQSGAGSSIVPSTFRIIDATAGLDRLDINSSGNVGIGTTTPWARLSAVGPDTTTGYAFALADSGNTPLWTVQDNGTFAYGKSSTTTIPNNVGYAWTIATSTTANPLLAFTTTSGSEMVTIGTPGSDVIIGGPNSSPNLIFQNSGTIEGSGTGQTINIGAGGDLVNFGVNVGIGSSTPNQALTVNGNINIAAGDCFMVNGTCIGYVTKLAYIYASTTAGTTTVNFTGSAGSSPSWALDVNGVASSLTLPANTVNMIVEMWSGGGAGGSSATSAGGSGGSSCFVTASSTACSTSANISLAGGTGGSAGATAGGAGGVASTTASNIAISGGAGFGGDVTTADVNGGTGGTAPRGGAGGQAVVVGSTGSNFGISPGGGGSGGRSSTSVSGGGGGGGAYAELLTTIHVPSTYAIGAGGVAGASGTAGGVGAAGGIVITGYATSSPTSSGNDYAEMFPVADDGIGPGQIVSVDNTAPVQMRLAQQGDTTLAGVVSTAPGEVVGDQNAPGERPVALSGRVPVEVSLQNGPIAIGDRIAISSDPGVGMKAGPFDNSVGIAMESYDGTGGTVEPDGSVQGTVTVFLDLQQGVDINSIVLGLLGPSNPIFAVDASTSASSTEATSTSPLDFVGGVMSAIGSRIASLTIFGAPATSSNATSTPIDEYATGFLQSIFSQLTSWFASATNGIGDFFANRVNTQQLCISDSTGSSTCITKAQLDALIAGSAASSGSGGSSGSPPPSGGGGSGDSTSTPPQISVNGDNPATVDVGATYNDLGAQITGPTPDLNLGITASVDGATSTPVSDITIDTSVAGPHTIVYSATDQNGLTGTATRTVNVVDPNADGDSGGDNGDASSTSATSTSP